MALAALNNNSKNNNLVTLQGEKKGKAGITKHRPCICVDTNKGMGVYGSRGKCFPMFPSLPEGVEDMVQDMGKREREKKGVQHGVVQQQKTEG